MKNSVVKCCTYLLSIATISLLQTAESNAGVLTEVSFAETNCNFTWVVKWESPFDNLSSSLIQATSNKWDLRADTGDFGPVGGFFNLDFKATGTHMATTLADRCDSADTQNSNPVSLISLDSSILPITVPDRFLDEDEVQHPGAPHFDAYDLYYRRPGAGVNADVIFTFKGEHNRSTALVPEPSGVAILALSLFSAFSAWRRRQVAV
ncbi:MAG: PEP-CTERM sorting domain-containing protein [Candidatus Accumulibacter sp.]|nr:PEP-CTERM sorting domain-containing protein [Accumulibacter sp.]